MFPVVRAICEPSLRRLKYLFVVISKAKITIVRSMKYNNVKNVFCPAYRSWFGVVEAGIEAGDWKPDAG